MLFKFFRKSETFLSENFCPKYNCLKFFVQVFRRIGSTLHNFYTSYGTPSTTLCSDTFKTTHTYHVSNIDNSTFCTVLHSTPSPSCSPGSDGIPVLLMGMSSFHKGCLVEIQLWGLRVWGFLLYYERLWTLELGDSTCQIWLYSCQIEQIWSHSFQ